MFVAWRDMRFARGRFALVGGVIVLMTMLVGLLSGLTAGLARESTSAVTGLAADRLVFARGAEGFSDSTVTAEELARWADRPGVTAAEPLGIAPGTASLGKRSTPVTVFGVAAGGELSGLTTTPGHGGVVLSEPAAEELDAAAGDHVRVGASAFMVAAVAGEASYSHTPVVWVAAEDWRDLVGAAPGSATVVALGTDSGFQSDDPQVRTLENSLSAIGSYEAERGSLVLIRGFLFVIAAVVVGAFFTVWTVQRAGDIAVLKALGASNGYVFIDALGQAAVLLLGGSAVGIALALAAGAAARGAVPFVLDLGTVGLPVATMVGLGLVGAALSVRRVTSVDPLTALGSAR